MFIDFDTAESDLMACAAFVAERIGSADGHSAAISDIALRYAAQGELDLAAGLADTIHDPHTRDTSLAEIASRCVEFDDDEYGLQLVEAIEDYGFQQAALTNIAVRQVDKGRFENALETVGKIDDQSTALAEIALRKFRDGDVSHARELFEQIELPIIRVQVLNEFATNKIRRGENADELFAESLAEVENLEFAEEKMQVLLDVAVRLSEAGESERALEVLEKAWQTADSLEGRYKDESLAQLSALFARVGNFERAAQVLEPIADLQQTANAYAAIALEYQARGVNEKAVETLEEALATLKSQPEREIRSSQARFNLFATIAVRFAQFGRIERALEIAHDNPDEQPRYFALTQIAAVSAAAGQENPARQAVNSIEDLAARQTALINVSDGEIKLGAAEKSLQTLNEAYALSEEVGQLTMRSAALNEIAVRFIERGERERAREILRENLVLIGGILDQSHQAVALANLADIYRKFDFEYESGELELLNTIARRRA